MNTSEDKSSDSIGKELKFQFGYQKRSKDDLFKSFIIENQKSIRGFKKILPIAIILFLIWLITKNLISLVIMIPFAALTIIATIGYFDIWRVNKKYENSQIPRRTFVKERTLKYGDYGIIFKELSKNGLSQEKYVWKRYGLLIEWEKYLFLLPAMKKASSFVIRKDEIGEANFLEFRDFAKSKLKYKLITNYKEII